MKTEELMIGDVVTFKDCQHDENPFIIKIWQINQDGDALVCIDNDTTLDEITIDEEVVGLPLTTEILEKSGLEHNIGEMYYHGKLMYHHESKYVSICYGANNYWHLHINNGCDFSKAIKYVHELQHALKLCGIDKEIVL